MPNKIEDIFISSSRVGPEDGSGSMNLFRETENPDSDPDPNGPENCATAGTKKM
jgi:hypothetical protein